MIKVKISVLKELENQGVIKIYDDKDAKKILHEQGLRRESNDTYENMRKNKEVLIEDEIPADMIMQVPKEQIKGRKC